MILKSKKTLIKNINPEDTTASFKLSEFTDNGLDLVLSMIESSFLSNTWLKPFAEKVKNTPPINKKQKFKIEKLQLGNINPTEAEKATVKDKRNLNKLK